MTLYSLSLVLTLTFGPGLPTDAALDIYPTFYAPANLPGTINGLALPHLILVDEEFTLAVNRDWRTLGYSELPRNVHGERYTVANTIRHEQVHIEQWETLGPAFPVLYALTLGRPFEDYLDGEMWRPAGDTRRCPLLRLHASPTTSRLSLFPCWSLTG